MSVFIENETDVLLNEKLKNLIYESIEAVLDIEEVPDSCEVSVTIVSNQDMQVINKQQRGIDKVTDVLSFPLLDFEEPSVFNDLLEDDVYNLDTDELMLGDIVLAIDRAKEQAIDYKHSLEREVGFLIIHSMLHLLGYDHVVEADETIMINKQKEILAQINLRR